MYMYVIYIYTHYNRYMIYLKQFKYMYIMYVIYIYIYKSEFSFSGLRKYVHNFGKMIHSHNHNPSTHAILWA